MKLLAYTSRIQLRLFIVLFGVFTIVFYLMLRWYILQNVDEVLSNRKVHLIAYFKEDPKLLLAQENSLDDFSLVPIDSETFQNAVTTFTDTLIYETVDKELDEYRKLTTCFQVDGQYYKLEILKTHIEANELIGTIAITLGGLFIALVFSFYFSQKIISRKIWGPFYELLEKLKDFRIEKESLPEWPETKIFEFEMLNKAISELSIKNKEIFDSQKQFIENASHEMQTPLSIIQSQLESLIGQAQLTQKQANIVQSIISSTQRLKKLNKTLLLLSKIENRQFLLNEEIDFARIIDSSLEYYEEQKLKLNIQVNTEIQNNPLIYGNYMLTEVLIQNLLKNAFLHNVKNGLISITLNTQSLTIANTGNKFSLDNAKIFNRFYKKSDNPDAWGLGLAIALKVAEVNGWRLSYSQNEKVHILELKFS